MAILESRAEARRKDMAPVKLPGKIKPGWRGEKSTLGLRAEPKGRLFGELES